MSSLHRVLAFACAVTLIDAEAAPRMTQSPPSAPGSAAKGERLFARKCAGCHSLVENRAGPRLGDVYGRRAGSAAGFRYSNAVTSETFIWSDSTLDAWLSGPQDFIAGAAMSARVGDAQERADIIAYLRTVTLSTDPARRR
jgi:cytochrome c2